MLKDSLAISLRILLKGPDYSYINIYKNLNSINYALKLANIY